MNIVSLNKWIPNLKDPLVIAGPCSAENEEQIINTAKELATQPAVRVFRAGIWKPRTRPNNFEGVGEVGLPWLQRVKRETGLLTAVEVANTSHVELALKYDVDILWLGARTSANPFSVQEIANSLRGVGVPVMVKNPVNADLALWIGALERINNAGINKLAAIHRGFSTYEKSRHRNPPMWNIPIELKRLFPNLPVICDPSHITGNKDLIPGICQKAMDVDMDGLMVESHLDPTVAMSDASQQITPTELGTILDNLACRTQYSTDRNFESELEQLRGQIDRIDNEIIESLQHRMSIVEKIGMAKVTSNITALQVGRMDELMKLRMAKGESIGLRPEYIKEIYNSIHGESVQVQTELMKEHKK
ncbi:MAG: bifunctional 3-deoxy-7-phosphoheptulonate synthase/chorismate mutase type II [Bacteriovoracaceae bacterium]|nr:bifunctional 3-deoxy-7-phosphoheptulonate synthase/chorismate mutase type II [Bacteriovoracaceae bacterium]